MCLPFLQPFPYLSQLAPNIPKSFLVPSQIVPTFPRSFAVLPPVPTVFQVFAVVFPLFSHFFPKSFPKSFPILPPNVASAPQGFCLHGFLVYSQGSPRSFFDLITRQALNQFFYKGCNRQNCFTGNPFFPLQKNPGFHCDFTGANTSWSNPLLKQSD